MEILFYQSGSADNPGDPYGHCVLVIDHERRAHLLVEHIRTREWEAVVSQSTIDAVQKLLAGAGFPPELFDGEYLPGETSYDLRVNLEGVAGLMSAPWEWIEGSAFWAAYMVIHGLIYRITGGEVTLTQEPGTIAEVLEAREITPA